MTGRRAIVSPPRTWLDRAVVDYFVSIDERTLEDTSVEEVAEVIGVSRATAYRHFRDRDGLLLRGAVELAYRHADEVLPRSSQLSTVMATIEENFAYGVVVRDQRAVNALLISPRCPDAVGHAMNEISQRLMAPVYRKAQADGQLRSDISVEQIIAWLNEQRRIVIRLDLDETATRRWVRKFVVPALRPPSVSGPSRAEMQAAFADLSERLRVLDAVLAVTRAALE